MKITTLQIRQLIKEELQNVMKEQEQLDEGLGIIAGLMATLFSPGVDKLEINNVELDRNQFHAVLKVVGEESPKALEVLKSDLEIFGPPQDKNGNDIPEVGIRLLNPNQTNAIVSGVVKSKQAKAPKAGSKKTGSFNIDLAIASAMGGDAGMQSKALDKLKMKVEKEHGSNPDFLKKIDNARAKIK